MAAPHDIPQTILHASTVAIGDRAIVIMGPSGSGKSTLALEMMARGAVLVADDRTCITRTAKGQLIAAPAPNIEGLIEARGAGVLTAQFAQDVPVCAVVDLGTDETDRLPPERNTSILGVDLPLFHNPGTPSFAPALVQYLKGGRHA